MFAVIYIPDFYLQAILRPQCDSLSKAAVALIETADSCIIQFTVSARDAGVGLGMTAVQALARCPTILLKTRSSIQERAAGQALLDCAAAFSPYVEATADGICTLDLKGLTIPSYLEWGAKLLDCLLRLNFAARVGVGATPLLARHAAQSASPFLAVENSRNFLKPLPLARLGPTAETLGILHKWGIRTVGEFVDLGRESLAERLGPEALSLFDCASATSIRPLKIVHPSETFEEAIEFEHEVETAEALLFVLHRFVEQLALRLEFLYLVAEELTLRLGLANGGDYKHVLKIPAPTRKISTLFGMLQTHLEGLRTEHPITALWLSARPCRPANEQLELFESTLRDPNQFYETLTQLTALVGEDRVGLPIPEPTHRPDAFRITPITLNIQNAETHLALKSRGLSLRRFRPPLPAQIERLNGQPTQLSSAKFKEGIFQALGPWHSSGDWWDLQPWAHLEWDVETSGGTLYRLFQQRVNKWFVDGIYD